MRRLLVFVSDTVVLARRIAVFDWIIAGRWRAGKPPDPAGIPPAFHLHDSRAVAVTQRRDGCLSWRVS